MASGLPQTHIVGLPDASVRESRERVRSAIKNSGFDLPPRVVVINLAPADLKEEGNHLDLAIALAELAALGLFEVRTPAPAPPAWSAADPYRDRVKRAWPTAVCSFLTSYQSSNATPLKR